MKKILFFLITLPILFSCVKILPESITLISKTKEDLVYSTNDSVWVAAGDLIQLSFSIDSSDCREERDENLVILLGNNKLWEEKIHIFPGTLETKKYTLKIPEDYEGKYTLKIIIGLHTRYFNVMVYRKPGDFVIIEHKIVDKEIYRGKKVKEKIKIANLREGMRKFTVIVNGKEIDEMIVASRIFEKEIEFYPILGINEIKICDEEDNCYSFYEYITEIKEAPEENITQPIQEGKTYINPYVIFGIIVILAFIVAKVIL